MQDINQLFSKMI